MIPAYFAQIKAIVDQVAATRFVLDTNAPVRRSYLKDGPMETTVSNDEDMQTALNEIVERLIERYAPDQIVLYGSLAWGEPHADSDIDLLIVKETDETPLQRRVHVRRLVAQPDRRVPFSPLVVTPDELEQRLSLGDPFYRQILTDGTVLYARG